MNKPTIELKKVKFGAAHSHQETINFVADLYINGKLVGYCENQGHGGMTSVHGNDKETNGLIQNIEKWYSEQSKFIPEGYSFEMQPSLDGDIDTIIEDMFNAKELEKMMKRLNKKTVNHLIMLNPKKDSTIEVKFNRTISEYLADSKGKEIIHNQIAKLKAKYPEWTLLNEIK